MMIERSEGGHRARGGTVLVRSQSELCIIHARRVANYTHKDESTDRGEDGGDDGDRTDIGVSHPHDEGC